MIKKGDMVSIALIMANVVFVCLLVTKGTFIASDTVGNNSSESALMVTVLSAAAPTATAQPPPTMTLAVNEGALLFAEIRSQPRQGSSAVSPSPSPTTAPDTGDVDIVSPVKRPSYTTTPTIIAKPPNRKVNKSHPKHP